MLLFALTQYRPEFSTLGPLQSERDKDVRFVWNMYPCQVGDDDTQTGSEGVQHAT